MSRVDALVHDFDYGEIDWYCPLAFSKDDYCTSKAAASEPPTPDTAAPTANKAAASKPAAPQPKASAKELAAPPPKACPPITASVSEARDGVDFELMPCKRLRNPPARKQASSASSKDLPALPPKASTSLPASFKSAAPLLGEPSTVDPSMDTDMDDTNRHNSDNFAFLRDFPTPQHEHVECSAEDSGVDADLEPAAVQDLKRHSIWSDDEAVDARKHARIEDHSAETASEVMIPAAMAHNTCTERIADFQPIMDNLSDIPSMFVSESEGEACASPAASPAAASPTSAIDLRPPVRSLALEVPKPSSACQAPSQICSPHVKSTGFITKRGAYIELMDGFRSFTTELSVHPLLPNVVQGKWTPKDLGVIYETVQGLRASDLHQAKASIRAPYSKQAAEARVRVFDGPRKVNHGL